MASSLQASRIGISSARQTGRRANPAQRERVGSWELVEFAAEGAFSQVFRARPADGAPGAAATYAVKRLKVEWHDDARAVSFLRREARVGRAINSPHLVPILDAGTRQPPCYLVMPWLEGMTLAARMASRAGLTVSIAQALWLARQVAEALDALDSAGWTHADVKPANIMVSRAGHATLIDLGLARRPADEDRTLDRTVVGTPWYMAPEMLLSTLRPDIRSDIFSLGAMLYEMLAGRVPFAAADAAALVTAHRQDEPVDLRELVPHVPSEVAQLVHAMLAKEPLRRPQTPRALVERLTVLEIAHLGVDS